MPVSLALHTPKPSMNDRRVFRYPLQPCPRIAVICDSLRVPAGCLSVKERSPLEPRSLRLEALAAPASALLTMKSDWVPSFPLVVFTGLRYGFLDEEDRERLWSKFRVPVFEQLLDDEGRILARECEAHAGLHVDPAVHYTLSRGEVLVNGRPTGISVREATWLCGCGAFEPRLIDPAPATSAFTRFSDEPANVCVSGR